MYFLHPPEAFVRGGAGQFAQKERFVRVTVCYTTRCTSGGSDRLRSGTSHCECVLTEEDQVPPFVLGSGTSEKSLPRLTDLGANVLVSTKVTQELQRQAAFLCLCSGTWTMKGRCSPPALPLPALDRCDAIESQLGPCRLSLDLDLETCRSFRLL